MRGMLIITLALCACGEGAADDPVDAAPPADALPPLECGDMACAPDERRCHQISPGMVATLIFSCHALPADCPSPPTCDCLGDLGRDCQVVPGGLRTHEAHP